jgi:ABC-2 type transport system ATP-binding protein
MTTASGAVLELDGVHRLFTRRGGIRDASVRLGPGEVVAVLGPNGCGKSTLLRVAASILRPDSGTVRRAPQCRLSWSEEEPRLQPEQTVLDYMSTFATLRQAPSKRVPELCEEWGVGDLLTRCGALSRGQRRRVGLARAFLGEPTIMLLDEPLSGLDQEWRDRFWTFVRAVGRDGRTAVLTMHTLEEAAMIPRSVVLWGGRVIFDGPTAETADRTAGLSVVAFEAGRRSCWGALEEGQRDGNLLAWRALDDGFEVLVERSDVSRVVEWLTARQLVSEPVRAEASFLSQVSHAG